jgi:hypothetical protein
MKYDNQKNIINERSLKMTMTLFKDTIGVYMEELRKITQKSLKLFGALGDIPIR